MHNPYSLKTVFTLNEASRAIAGVIEVNRANRAAVEIILSEMVEAARRNQFSTDKVMNYTWKRVGSWEERQTIKVPTDTNWANSTIARADLLAWCEARGIRPALLFPESEKTDQPLHANEHNALLKIIRALAELHGIKSNSAAYRKEAESLLAKFSSKGIESPCNDKTLAKHLKEAFLAR